jgi:hypothetical protein
VSQPRSFRFNSSLLSFQANVAVPAGSKVEIVRFRAPEDVMASGAPTDATANPDSTPDATPLPDNASANPDTKVGSHDLFVQSPISTLYISWDFYFYLIYISYTLYLYFVAFCLSFISRS